MTLSSCTRGLFTACSAIALVAACTDADVSSPGDTGSVVVVIGDDTEYGSGDFDGVPSGACPEGTVKDTFSVDGGNITACIIGSGDEQTVITQDITLTADNLYALSGTVIIGSYTDSATMDSAVLTIDPGTVIAGSQGRDALVISRGSRIEAKGTAEEPVIFTSAQDILDGTGTSASDRAGDGSAGTEYARGQWGGLVLNGLAPVNDCSATGETGGAADCTKNGEGGSGSFGGDRDDDSSGTLEYVRVQYAGYAFSDDNELNGIAFQGVGNGTTVSHVHVHNNGDDGVEFFGGTVDVTNLVITGADDDSIDWTDGWTGSIQHAVVVMPADDAGNRGMEGDNRSDSPGNTPVSDPVIANFTLLGGGTDGEELPGGDTRSDDGMKLRAGTLGTFVNGIVTGFADGVDYSNSGTGNGVPSLNSVFVGGNGENFAGDALGESAVTRSATSTLANLFPGVEETAVVPANAAAFDSVLDETDYIGAFDPVHETPAENWTTGWTLPGTLPFGADACPEGTTPAEDIAVPAGRPELRVCNIAVSFTQDATLTAGSLYRLEGTVAVGEDAGGDSQNPVAGAAQVTLTIDPGVTIFGADGRDMLYVERGSKIIAGGISQAPVVFTSYDDVHGNAGETDRGRWGGLVINGRAPVNHCSAGGDTDNPATCEKNGEGGSGLFGGNDPDDSSGSLSYVRVQYAGYAFSDDNELNGIAFQGVGSGTSVSHIQVHNNGDDGIEFFGGNVNAKYVVITGADDDSIDWTDGWTGKMQYLLVVMPLDAAGDRGMEGDNRSDSPALQPVSDPVIANFTLVGDGTGGGTLPDGNLKSADGMKLRAGTQGRFVNGIVTGFVDGLDYDDAGTDGSPLIQSVLLTGNISNLADDTDTATLNDEVAGNIILGPDSAGSAAEAVTFEAPEGYDTLFVAGNLNDVNAQITDLLDFNQDSGDAFFDGTDYIGAVEDADDDWYRGWTLEGSF